MPCIGIQEPACLAAASISVLLPTAIYLLKNKREYVGDVTCVWQERGETRDMAKCCKHL